MLMPRTTVCDSRALLIARVVEPGSDSQKPRGRVWPGLTSVGGDIQPQQVTVLTPATQRRYDAFYPENKIRQCKKICIEAGFGQSTLVLRAPEPHRS